MSLLRIRGFIIIVIFSIFLSKNTYGKLIEINPFFYINNDNILKMFYGINTSTNIFDILFINAGIDQIVINKDNFQKNIISNIVATNLQTISVLDKFNNYNYGLKIKTPEFFKSKIIFSYNRNNIFNKDDILYISQNMLFFNYDAYDIKYEINFNDFILDFNFKYNYIYDNIKNNSECGINYTHKLGSNTKLTIGYSYSYDVLKDNFDDNFNIKYLEKDNSYLYFKYNKRVAQINKSLLINKTNSLKLISNFNISNNITVNCSIIGTIDNHNRKNLFFGFGLGMRYF